MGIYCKAIMDWMVRDESIRAEAPIEKNTNDENVLVAWPVPDDC